MEAKMRVVVISDTHYNSHWARILGRFILELTQLQPDCLVLAGDVGDGARGFDQMLTLLDKVPCPHLILTGNHDVWNNQGKRSQELWESVLPRLTRDHGAIWLEGENWIKDGLAICGTNGWYDYSACDKSFAYTAEEYNSMKPRYMVDGRLIDWQWNDVEFANLIGTAFEQRLAALEVDPTVREIIVVTHVPPFQEGITFKRDDSYWNFRNAYFGNLTLGQRIRKFSKVRHVVSGHTHVGRTAQIGKIKMVVLPSDYGLPAYQIIDYQTTPVA
jgi:3',5'-cyclic AMP phosphodiesterase CpdA